MKKYFFLFLIGLSLNLILQAQINKTTNVSAGTLFESLTADERNLITSLTITGTIDARDFRTMGDNMARLTELDLSGVHITAYSGTDGPFKSGNWNYPANAIPVLAFRTVYTRSLSSIVFPSTLTSIGSSAFEGCIRLNSLTIPSSVKVIGNAAFRKCIGLKSLTIPSSVISIEAEAFSGCKGLSFLDLPSTLTSLGGNAFYGCNGLTSVAMPSSLTTIKTAFSFCTGLTQIILPDLATTIEFGAFQGCTGLTSISIPQSVTEILGYAFSNCTGLTSVNIPSGVSTIGEFLFSNCTKLASVTVEWAVPPVINYSIFYMVDRTTCTLHVPYGTTSQYRANSEWNEFKNIVETSNGFYLSANSAKVSSPAGSSTTIDLKANVSWTASSDQTWLSVSSGSGTTNNQLTFTAQANPSISSRTAKVTISSTGFESKTITITQNGADVLLSNVTPGSLMTLLPSDDLTTLTNLILKGNIDARDFKTIRDEMPNLTDLDLSGVSIAAYKGNEGTISPDFGIYAANTIPEEAFLSYEVPSKLTSIVLPGSVIGIGNYAFGWGLISLKVNNPLPVVFNYYSNVFSPIQQNCTLNVPYGSASRYALAEKWKDFAHVKEATVGFNLSSYNDTIAGAEGTTHMVDITANVSWSVSSDQDWLVVNPATGNGNQRLTFTAKANELFINRKATITVTGAGVSSQLTTITQVIQPQPEKLLEVTAGGLAAALNTDELNTISILTLKGTMDARDFKTMSDQMPLLAKLDLSGVNIVAYSGTEGTSLNYGINYPVNTIPETAFYGRNPLTGINVGKTSLTSIVFPSTLTSIGSDAFAYSTNLSSLTIPTSVTSIGSFAFEFCTNLTSVTIPSSVTSFGSYAFAGCEKIASVLVNWPVPITFSSYAGAFSYATQNTAILNVPFGTSTRYATAQGWEYFTNIQEMPGFLPSENNVKVGFIQGSNSSVDILSNVEWTATSDQTWLSVSPVIGTGMEQKLTFTAESNPLFTPRTAIITVSAPGIVSQTVTITQIPAPVKIEVIAGGLSSVLSAEELMTITDLTITGTIDARDFKTMRDKMPSLTKLNLNGAIIAAYNGNEGTNALGNVNYPANKIPEYAFYKNISTTSFTSIIFPQSITSIGRNAFLNCVGLTGILIPQMVITIDSEAFSNCTGVKTLTLSSSVISLGSQAFRNCNNLTSITVESSIPPNLGSSYNVFYQVDKSLCVLNVPYKSAGDYRIAYQWGDFQNILEATDGFHVSANKVNVGGTAASIATLDIDANNEWTASSDQDWLVVNPTSGNGLSQALTFTADANPSFIAVRTAIVILSAPGVASQNITVTQSVHPQSPKTLEVTSGGLTAALTDVELAIITDLTLTGTIDARDFKTMRDKMPLLAKLDLSGTTIVAYNGTEGTSSIGNTIYPPNTIPEYAFVSTTYGLQGKSSLTSILLPESLTAFGNYSFARCFGLTELIIPASVTEIGSYAFWGCSKISELTIPTAVTTIGILAFGNLNSSISVDSGNLNYSSSNNVLFNKAQTELIQSSFLNRGTYEIPSTVTSIGDNAFNECLNLTSVTIPLSVTSIGKYAFNNCKGLSTLNIPSSVTFIGGSAFALCQGLKTIYTNSITPVNLESSPNVFYQLYFYGCTLYVPIGSKSGYQTANQWMNFRNIIEVNPHMIANAGPDQIINEETSGSLEGSVSVNTNGNTTTYQWTAPEGITLSSGTEAKPTFTAPKVTNDTYFTFSLIVSDGLMFSTADQVTVTVRNVYKAPVADAGTDQTVNENSLVTLDGTASVNPENNKLTYEWISPAGISLSSKYSSKPTFTAPEITIDTDFTFPLQVNNGYYYKTDTVVITVKQANKAPIANAGTFQYKNEGSLVTLDGTASTDADGDALTYLWTAPADITLNSNTGASPYFTAPSVKTDTRFTFTLVVNDGKLNSASTEVSVMVRHIYPLLNLTANANNLTLPVYLNYKLFMKEEDSFIQKIDTFSITGDTIHLSVEPGEWIALASPARDTSAFVPTYVGNVLDWNEAEIIRMDDNSNIFRKITFIIPEIAKTGVGQILGIVYENPDSGAKSVSISKTNITFSNPVQQVLVRLYRKGSGLPVASVFTDSLGAYSFDKLDLSDYEIVIELPGYIQSDKFTLALSANEPVATANFGVNTSSQVITDNELLELSLIKIYPNPTNGIIHISGLPEKTENKISIYSIDGKKVLEKITNLISETIDISSQISGTFILILNKQRFKIIKK